MKYLADCKNESLRLAFVHLAKRFHPDNRTQEANTVKFSQVLYHIIVLLELLYII